MGTACDDLTQRAHSDDFETKMELSKKERQVRDHRLFHRKVIKNAEFTPNPTEWWHYSYGDQTFACTQDTDSLHGRAGLNGYDR
ncbi:M15 family metallopeptidase [Sporolactobacillus sp. Y61]|jgi:D-alanyl-D-alanine dipeptidase|uniref:M15 family metallopeptidase n=1 Tax=Sporolactobacillus sp. Y61 TaxID=3160863 RepID=A0AAU8IH10_9BACL|nr:M15 family metallopeptidase [Sporolactobacillus sp. THM19-2]RYL94109.1 hypothetical protein EWH91_02890 [Sporolactobacillus sp. THM19-2]